MPVDGATRPTIQVKFRLPEWGWIAFSIQQAGQVWKFAASNTDDPFDHFLPWLEKIAAGAQMARWCISEEGRLSQLVFVGESFETLDRAGAQLVLMRNHWDRDVHDLQVMAVARTTLVRAFYEGFRTLAERRTYKTLHWESMGMTTSWIEGDYITDGEFKNRLFKSMKSPLIEDWLSHQPAPST